MENIKEFVTIKRSDGSGYGSGFGNGSCSGYGNGDGSGCGSCSSYGNGYGSGFGSDYGSGNGFGSNYGSGNGFGSGYGYGSGLDNNLQKINNYTIYSIDKISTIITKVKNNIAKGFIVREDLTFEPCFVVKHNNTFAHGKTLHEARKALENKMYEEMDVDERIEMFLEHFKLDEKYQGSEFFEWHNRLTNSCKMGREVFVKNKGLSLDDYYTVDEFIALTENEFGGEIIKKLKEVKNNEL